MTEENCLLCRKCTGFVFWSFLKTLQIVHIAPSVIQWGKTELPYD